jgi:hyaluronoglucosaminidase
MRGFPAQVRDGQPASARRVLLAVLAVAGCVVALLVAPPSYAAPSAPLPTVSPKPQQMERSGRDAVVTGKTVRVISDSAVDQPTRELVTGVLNRAGAATIESSSPGEPTNGKAPLTVRVGALTDPDIRTTLHNLGVSVPADLPAEGYVLAVNGDPANEQVVVAGVDGDGTYYAAQTLRQLVVSNGDWSGVAGVRIVDYPRMPLRGTIEGFYGSPWTPAERLDQMSFYGDMKMNTYIYAPKDDPYHRDQWRDPYPADKYAELTQLVQAATDNHVKFTFALSPGLSICYTSTSDYSSLIAKFQAMYDIGVRAFSIPFDDIGLSSWNCAEDQSTYGAASQTTIGRAQTDLLNKVQHDFVDTHAGVNPLEFVPTQYGDLSDTAYKQQLRTGGWNGGLDPRIVIMWTGTDVIPPAITIAQAQQVSSSSVWGRKVFVWDNYPVNDYSQTAGRLLLAPYQKRDPGLSAYLSGIVGNPMNQAGASKIALFTIADFTWNDLGYDYQRSWKQAALYLTAGNEAAASALLTFADLNYLAPTFGTTPWLAQSPGLSAEIAGFWQSWNAGRYQQAIDLLRPVANAIAAAPATIRAGVWDQGFLSDASNWLDATALWGQAFVASLDALQARIDGDLDQAASLFAQARSLRSQAGAIRSVPGENRFEGPVKIGDGVLDTLLSTFEVGTIVVTSDTNPSTFGQPVTFTATVTPMSGPNALPASGTVQFRNGNANLNAAVPVGAGGHATTTSTLSAGNRSITAIYTQTGAIPDSVTSPPLTQVVSRAATATSVASSANPADVGQPVTFTASVAAVPPGAGTPTGSVQFVIDGANAGSRTALSGGLATFTTSTLGAGTHTVAVTYAQTTNFAASASPTLSQVVN